jgi:hypothetical protein
LKITLRCAIYKESFQSGDSGMAVINEFREAVANWDVKEAAEHAAHIVSVMGAETPVEVFDFLDKASVKSQHAAMACATTFLFREQPTPGHRLKLLKKASRTDDADLAAMAYFAIGIETLTHSEHPRKAIAAFQKSSELGNLESNIMLAQAFEQGLFGERDHINKAFNTLAKAVDEDYGPAKIALAEFSFRNGIHDEDYCPHQLLEEAADDGIAGAAELLMMLEESHGQHEELSKLPYQVVPKTLTRPQHIRDAICNELHCSFEGAATLVAGFHGFDTWEALVVAVADISVPEGTYDEDCSIEEMTARRHMQIDILDNVYDAPPFVIEAIWELLQPTSRDYRPSLRKLEEVVNEKADEFMASGQF